MTRIVYITSLVAFFSAAAVCHASACDSELSACQTRCGPGGKWSGLNNTFCFATCDGAFKECRNQERLIEERRRFKADEVPYKLRPSYRPGF